MSEIKKYRLIGEMVERSRVGGANYVLLADFDRVTAERDAALKTITELLEDLTPPQPIYDEVKERALFEQGYHHSALARDGDEYIRMSVQLAWEGWEKCAQSRAKAGEAV